MEFWSIIEECLWDEGVDALNEDGVILWKGSIGSSHSVRYKDVAYDGDKLAWYLEEEYGRCTIRIKYANGIILNWRLASKHQDYGFRMHYIKWFGDKLIVIYSEKHTDRIVEINNLTINFLYVGHFNNIQIVNDNVYVQLFHNQGFIHKVSLNSKYSNVERMSITTLKSPTLNFELETFAFYFFKLDEDYNKVSISNEKKQ